MKAPAVRASAVTKRWGATTALAGVSFEIGSGITGLLGPNGAGKTTLIECMLGLHRTDGGTLEVRGLDPSTAGPDVRAQLGYAPENDCLPTDDRAQDFVRHMAEIHGIPRRLSAQRASDAMYLVGLGEERFRPIGSMSTGQRQRVKLAQAIVHDPVLVLLDEPTNGLDPLQRDDMLALVTEVGRRMGIDVLLASHLLGEVERVCEAVVVLDQGRVVASGGLDELRGHGSDVVVELDGKRRTVARALTDAGAKVRTSGTLPFVRLDGDATYDLIRDAVADAGAGIRRMRRASASLEDVFFRATSETPA